MQRAARPTALAPLALAAISLAACPPVDPDEGSAAQLDAYQTRPRAAAVPTRPDDRSPQWIVRQSQPDPNNSGRHGFGDIAVAGGYLYFTVQWEGVYRSPLAGGPLEVADTGDKRHFRHLAAYRNDVYWTSTRSDERHYPILRVRHLASPTDKPRTLLDNQQLGTYDSNVARHFQASAAGVSFIAGPNGAGARFNILRISPGDRAVKPLLPIRGDLLEAPTWVIDGSHLYFAASRFFLIDPPDAFVRRVVVEGGTPEEFATRPNMELAPHAVDDTHVYLASSRAIYTLSKSTGTVAKLAETPHFIQVPFLAVDDRNVYYVESPVDGAVKIYAAPKQGGAPTVIGEITEPGRQQITGFAQDATDLYLIARYREIGVLPKPGLPAPEAIP